MNRAMSSLATLERVVEQSPQAHYLSVNTRAWLARRGLIGNDAVGVGVVVIVVAVAAFLALAAIIGACAAYIWYCQQRGLWPTMDVPWRTGGTFRLYCS